MFQKEKKTHPDEKNWTRLPFSVLASARALPLELAVPDPLPSPPPRTIGEGGVFLSREKGGRESRGTRE